MTIQFSDDYMMYFSFEILGKDELTFIFTLANLIMVEKYGQDELGGYEHGEGVQTIDSAGLENIDIQLNSFSDQENGFGATNSNKIDQNNNNGQN